jgi:hypothetical protein
MPIIKVTAIVDITDITIPDLQQAIQQMFNRPLQLEGDIVYNWADVSYQTIAPPPDTKCAGCGTTENLHPDLGSCGPFRCNSPDCIAF